jgi:hypothetical protein
VRGKNLGQALRRFDRLQAFLHALRERAFLGRVDLLKAVTSRLRTTGIEGAFLYLQPELYVRLLIGDAY